MYGDGWIYGLCTFDTYVRKISILNKYYDSINRDHREVINAWHGIKFIANDPRNALSNFKPNHYDIALIDIRMPDMNGFDLYKEMKKLDSHIKVCFITGYEANYKTLQEIFPHMTQESYISKPTAASDLKKYILHLLQKSQLP